MSDIFVFSLIGIFGLLALYALVTTGVVALWVQTNIFHKFSATEDIIGWVIGVIYGLILFAIMYNS